MVSTGRLILGYLGGLAAAGVVAIIVVAALDAAGYGPPHTFGLLPGLIYVALLVLVARTVKRAITGPIPDFRKERRGISRPE